MQLDWTDQICFYLEYSYNLRPFLHSKSILLKNPISLNGHDACDFNIFRGPAHSHTATSADHTEESHFGSFIYPLSPFNPSICLFFFPKHCVSDTCNILVAGVSARDLLLDLSLLTLSTTCPLFLWGFYYKTAITPLISTRHEFNPRSPDHCGPLGLETPLNTECNMRVILWNISFPSKRGVEARVSRRKLTC